MADKYIKWDFTGKCNLRCRHCSVGKQYFSGDVRELSPEEKLEVVENLATGGVKAISFLGGEPLVLDHDFFAVAERAALRGMKTTLVTNGTLLDEGTWGRLLDSGIDQVVVSLDGAGERTHGYIRGRDTFGRVTRNLRGFSLYATAHHHDVRIKINTVLNRQNMPEIPAMLDLCRSLRVDEWSLLSLGGIGYAEDHIDELGLSPEEEIAAAKMLAQANESSGDETVSLSPQFAYPLIWDYIEQQYGLRMPRTRVCCNAAINLGFVGPDGMMYPCDRIANKEYRGAHIGNAEIRPFSLLDNPFYEIWNSDYFVNMFAFILDTSTYRDYQPCNHCKYLFDRSCNPCPLYSITSKVAIHSCLIAEKALGDISGKEESPSEQMKMERTEKVAGSSAGVAMSRHEREIPVKKEGVRIFAEEDLGILLNPYTTDFTGINRIGREVWDMIDGNNSVGTIIDQLEQIAREVKKHHAADSADTQLADLVRRNVLGFFVELSDAGLISFKSS